MSTMTLAEVDAKGIPFWDRAAPGDLCGVPCWPVDENGDALDCPDLTVLVGVLGEHDDFRAEEEVVFHPCQQIWTCARCSPTSRSFVGQGDPVWMALHAEEAHHDDA